MIQLPALNPYGLLAQASNLPSGDPRFLEKISENHNKGFRHDLPWELLLVGLGMTMVVIVVISLRRWWMRRQEDPSPLVLFSAIARKAGLSWSDRLVLLRIARANDLPTPIALLLARGTLRYCAVRYAARCSGSSRARLSARLKRIEAELFG